MYMDHNTIAGILLIILIFDSFSGYKSVKSNEELVVADLFIFKQIYRSIPVSCTSRAVLQLQKYLYQMFFLDVSLKLFNIYIIAFIITPYYIYLK